MANVYIEPRPKGRDAIPITEYVVEDHADARLPVSKPSTKRSCGPKRKAMLRWSPASDI